MAEKTQEEVELYIAKLHYHFDNAQYIARELIPGSDSQEVAYAMLLSLVSSERGENWYSFLEEALNEVINQDIAVDDTSKKLLRRSLRLVVNKDK